MQVLHNFLGICIYLLKNKIMGVGINIRKLRNKTKYSQQNIADMLNVDKNTYANWESETNDIKSEHLPKLAEIFDVRIQDLFDKTIAQIEINFNKQINNDSTVNNSVVFVMPDKESVDKLVDILKERL
jgi:transcriptional regulator with XRE-family HTH domain